MEDTALFSLAQLGVTPITPEAPCGTSARYEPEYEQLEAEMAKLESLTPQPVDWNQVLQLGMTILKTKSKDLLVASYLTRGLFEKQGYVGLEIALTIYRDLIKEYWDPLFPEKKRMRGRTAAITWMAERVGKAITQRQPVASDHEAVKHCADLAAEISQLLDEQLSDQSPDLTTLLRPLKEFQTQIAQQEKQEEQKREEQQKGEQKRESQAAPLVPETKPAPPPPPSPPPAALPAEITAESDVQKAMRHCQRLIGNVVTFLRNANLADPLPYRLIRVGTWMMLKQLPPHQNQVTQITKASPDVLQQYRNYQQTGDYQSLIAAVEDRFPNDPFWLDVHRFTAIALDALGPAHAEAKKAVIDELRGFLQRFPGVIDLRFSDGTPLADEQTRLWIENVVLEKASESLSVRTVGVVSSEHADQQPWLTVAKEARQLAAQGKFVEGITLFQEGQKKAVASERERFLWRLYQARFCFEAGYLEVAIPQLEFLDTQVERFALETWEPVLSLEVAQLLLLCYYKWLEKTQKTDGKIADKAEQLHARLCRLDVVAALATAPSKR
jgi:type VI secretion system protein VasJ